MDNIFELIDVKKYFSEKNSLEFGSIVIPRGRTIAILGESGCGKTTLLNILALMDNLKEGEGEVFYRPLSDTEKRYSRFGHFSEVEKSRIRGKNFGFVFQNDHLMDNYSSCDNCRMPTILNGYKIDGAVVEEAMSKFRLKDKINSNPGDLSGGQRSRIGIIRSFLHDPEIIFADEPTANLDKKTENDILAALVAWKNSKPEKKRTLLLVTHNLAMAIQWGDYFIVFPSAKRQRSGNLLTIDGKQEAKRKLQVNIRYFLDYPRDALLNLDEVQESRECEENHQEYQKFFNTIQENNPATTIENVYNHTKLIFRDFIRHPREKGSKFVMWGPPVIIILTILLMISSLFLISGMKKGTNAMYHKELSHPFLWQTLVHGENVDRVSSTLFQEKTGFHPVYQTFRNPATGKFVDLYGRTMDSDDPLLPKMRKTIRSPGGLDKEKILDSNDAFGVIISENALKKLGLLDNVNGSKQYPTKVELVFPVTLGKGRGALGNDEVYLPLPILGIANQLPYGEIILSEGFIQQLKKGKLNEALLVEQIYVPFDTKLDFDSFKKELKKAFLDLKNDLDLNFKIDEIECERSDGVNTVYISFTSKAYYFVFGKIVDVSFKSLGWGNSPFLFDPEYKFRPENQYYRHWSYIMRQDIDLVQQFIDACNKEDLFVDTTIKWKVESLENSMRMFKSLFNNVNICVIIFSSAIIILILWFDSYRRIHNTGVFFSLGGNISRYTFMICTQIFIICGFSLCFAIFIGEAFLFNHFCDFFNEVVGANHKIIAYEALNNDIRLVLSIMILFMTCFVVSFLKFIIFKKSPSELIRYQD